MATDTHGPNPAPAPLRDQRQTPRGVLPRQLQMWLMVGIAVVILLIVLITGHSQPADRPPATDRLAAAALPAADRIRAYQQQLKDDEARLQHVQAQEAAATRQPGAPGPAMSGGPAPTPTDPLDDERRRREYQSLFADNVVASRRAAGDQLVGESGPRKGTTAPVASAAPPDMLAALAILTQAQSAAASRVGGPSATPPTPIDAHTGTTSSANAATPKVREENPAAGPRVRLLEGTVIETVLLNRLDGTFAGPVECQVTTPVYSHDRQTILIPAGARVLGTAAPVQTWGDSRLAVSFHRLLMPDGHTYSLDVFKGLDQAGETGLKDEVNRHYRQVFGASLAIGAISGLAQYGTAGGLGATSFGDEYRQAAGASLAASTGRILDRYLNVLPTVTIREGFRIKVYLTNDFDLPAYAVTGGVQ